MVPLTISSSSDPSTAGEKVTISGRLTSAATGAAIKLWERRPGQSRFSQVAQTKTDSAGSYKFSRRPDTDREWYVTGGSKTSTTLSQEVQARITLGGIEAFTVSPGTRVTLSGSATPRHTGERIADPAARGRLLADGREVPPEARAPCESLAFQGIPGNHQLGHLGVPRRVRGRRAEHQLGFEVDLDHGVS